MSSHARRDAVDEVQEGDATAVDDLVEFREVSVPDPGDHDLMGLTEALEGADELPIEERLTLLRRAEEAIAGSLEGLDGL